MGHVDLEHLPPLPSDRSVGIGCIGAGFIMADCHLVAYRAAGLNPVAIAAYLAAIRDTGYDDVVSIELEYSPEPERIVEWVAEAQAETARLMRETGCR
jgi:hypothetical protein